MFHVKLPSRRNIFLRLIIIITLFSNNSFIVIARHGCLYRGNYYELSCIKFLSSELRFFSLFTLLRQFDEKRDD